MSGAQLSVTDQRRATRHPVDFPVIGEHRARGDVPLHVCNISAHGFMVDEAPELYAIIERLAASAGMPMPSVHLIPSHSPNAFATGRGP